MRGWARYKVLANSTMISIRNEATAVRSITLAILFPIILLLSDMPALARDDQPLPRPAWVSMVDQRSSDARLAGYLAPREIKLEVIADGPLLTHTGEICFDRNGSLLLLDWRAEAAAAAKTTKEVVTYRDGSSRAILHMSSLVKDAIRCVSDPGNKRAFEQAQVVLEEELVSSMLSNGDWLYTASRGTIRRYRRSTPEGHFDGKEVIARGFGGPGLRPACGLSFDFDGSLIIAVGPGTHDVEGSDGSRAQASGSGAIFRCRPNGAKMELLALGLNRPCGAVVFDKGFDGFRLENVGGNSAAACRLLRIAEASDYAFRSLSPARANVDDVLRRHCLRDLPGVMEPVYQARFGQSAGLCINRESRFPAFVQGLVLCPDPINHSVQALKTERRDSTFVIAEAFELVHSSDSAFNPWQLAPGPDGALYLIERPEPAANRAGVAPRAGRLYRLSWSGGPAHPALALRDSRSLSHFGAMNAEDLVKALNDADRTDRQSAQQELILRGATVKAALLKAVGDREWSAEARTLAAGALCNLWDDEVKIALIRLATDDDTNLRRVGAECLGRYGAKHDAQIQEVLLHILGDPDPITRRSVALAMAHVAAADAADCVATTLSFDIGGDAYLRDGLVRALEYLGKPGLERILALANSGEPDLLELAVNSFCALRSPSGLEMLPLLLVNPHLQPGQRVRLIRSLARYRIDKPQQLSPIVRYAVERRPAEPEFWLALGEVLSVQLIKGPGGFVQLLFLVMSSVGVLM
jgi:quinoprotein glucose dehydrogenase